MRKRYLSMIMIMILAVSSFAFTGCSQSGSASNDGAATASAEDGSIKPLTIKFSSTYQETETGGIILKHFMDKVGELSDGAIDVNMSWGGTLFTANDELDAVIDGSVNMVALAHMPHLNTLPYLSFPAFAPGSSQGVLDYFQTLVFDDPQTSALIQQEASDMGIKYLNVIAGGANAFCAKYEFDNLESLAAGSSAFGNMDAAIFENLGFQVTSIFPPEVYDALNRGLIDSTQMAFSPMIAMSWYEPATYWALDGTYAAGNFFTVNTDWWNALSAEQQQVIEAAAKETQDFTAVLYDDAIAADIEKVEQATGQSFIEFDQDDIDRIWAATFEAKADSALELAGDAGKTEGMVTILKKAAEITNYEWNN